MEPGGDFELGRSVRPLAEAMATPDTPLDVMALAVSSVLHPGLDSNAALGALDRLADDCAGLDRDAIMVHLFAGGLFRGDRRSYHDWRNSCLDQVLTRRIGMPITLAVVAIAVGRRLGVPLAGIGMPGHFLVGDPSDPDWFADPFNATAALRRIDCRRLFEASASGWAESFLAPTPDRQVIARVLNNLRVSCDLTGDRVRLALVMCARQTMPEFAAEAHAAEAATAVFN